MINVKKGTAHSLLQSDFTGTLTVNAITRVAVTTGLGVAVTAGQIVSKTGSSGAIVKGLGAVTDQVGFAVTTSTEGDAIESGKIGAYALDGNSIIGTDQVYDSIDYTNFPYGSKVYAIVAIESDATAGKVTKTSTSNLLVGTTDSISTVYVGQTATTLLNIKLA